MPETPPPSPGRPFGEFKARLNRDIAFTIIDEQIRAGIDQAVLTGRGLAKQYGFGSPQTWVTHLKDWRQQHGLATAASEEGVREAETTEAEPAAEPAAEEGGRYGVISRSEFLQHQEMWNRLLAEREQAHAERLKVARLEGENAGRVTGRDEGQALAEARERTLEERARRERLEGEREGAQRAQQELAQRLRGERRLLVTLAFILGLPLGALAGGAALWWRLSAPEPAPSGTPAGSDTPPSVTPTPLSAAPTVPAQPVPTPPVAPMVPDGPADAVVPVVLPSAAEGGAAGAAPQP